jgi:hypothetical protein
VLPGAGVPHYHRLENSPDVLDNNAVSLRCWVDAIILVQFRMAGHPLQEKGDQCDLVKPGEVREQPPEVAGIGKTIVRRQHHSGEDHIRAVGRELSDDGFQILPGRLNRKTPQTVVCTQLYDHYRGPKFANGRYATEALGRGVAAHTGVDHPIAVSFRIQLPLQLRRIALICINTTPCSQTVTECRDHGAVLGKVGPTG